MSKTALNLIAICVFAMTLSTLLGPLLNISPYVPAIATLTILGVGTLDTLTWQGQGVNLLLDWLASASPEHRARVVRHEAGHFLVAQLLEIPVSGYVLSAWEAFKQGQPGQGGVTFDDRELASQLQQRILSAQLLNRYGIVWMAGIAAETLIYGNAEGGAEDRQKLATLLEKLGRPVSEYPQQERSFALQARTLLQSHWKSYEALVVAMEQRASVTECSRIVAQYCQETLKS
ncbi:ATP-dependent Zn protease [Planktothrix sp. FACHB-1355]|uniref:ATP-dependent Zn protease n=1 Tax=Aerosakkonema funiforme FACHB-1375 TaxID=2949571 RepID=A0A926VC52_9CYAN|nr:MULTISPECIES: ATP-dependent Zn protease [Oscillatoriales]MBD2180970.1 ATP-dependent Zn protease [Aerosakkonema funiforme FACHB-1375]MBD3561668.1 ATP-dependent Zn protease [Planktothrix sp. FACHB-1355]